MKRFLYDYIFRFLIKNSDKNRKVFMWAYGLGEADMIDDISSTNCL